MNFFTIFATLCFVASLQHTEGHKPDLCEFMNQYIQERYEEFEERINRTTDRKMKVNNERLERKITELEARLEKALNSNPAASGCETAGTIFSIKTENSQDGIEVYCDLTSDGGGWTVFQRRMDGSVDFYRGWDDYVNGFGEKDKEFWLGLETIYQLTKNGNYELRVDMGDWEGNTAYAQYGTFSIAGSDDNYRLTVGDYSGNAGDSLRGRQNGRQFSTKDRDNDENSDNCAVSFTGAWWYESCHASNLNGVYHVGGTGADAKNIAWYYWRNTLNYSYKFTEMKFRKKQN